MWKCNRIALVVGTALLMGQIELAAQADSLIDVNSYRALTSDRRAYRVGEPIVILVVESTTAESSAGTGARSDMSIGVQAFDGAGSHEAGVGVGGHDEGTGQTTRKGRAFTQLSTRIVEALPNNMFRIAGEQNLLVNGENQKVVISGLVRADDISKDNSLLSNRIADAKIEIAGDGVINDAQRQNIIYRVLSWLGLV